MPRKDIFAALMLLAGMLTSGAALAIPSLGDLDIDFRTAPWAAGFGSTDITIGGVMVVAGPAGSTLYQDSTDGFGILGGEPDEIELQQALNVDFGVSGMWLTGVWITDLFAANDGGADGEDGAVTLNLFGGGVLVIDFNGNASDQGNGEQFISFGGSQQVLSAVFYATDDQGDEFSVAGFVGVPEPGTLLLLGSGLLLVGITRRRRIRR